MPLPALINGPWEFDVGNDCTEAAYNDTAKHSYWQVKESLIGFSQWSIVASCDSATVRNIGDDPGTIDQWSDWTTDLVSSTGAHSWIILENSINGEQLCIDMDYGAAYRCFWIYSATGSFNADGTTTDRPTSSEESQIMNTSYNCINTGTEGAIVNVMVSADGKCTRVYVHMRDGALEGGFFFGLEELVNTPSQSTGTHKRASLRPYYHTYVSDIPKAQSPRVGEYDATSAKGQVYLEDVTPYAGWDTAFYTAEVYNQWNANQGGNIAYETIVTHEWDEGYRVGGVGLFRNVNPRGGGMGAFQDLYWANQFHYAQTTYPEDGAATWIKIGCFFMPWNGTTPLNVP